MNCPDGCWNCNPDPGKCKNNCDCPCHFSIAARQEIYDRLIASEPFLDPCFELGAQWYSYDNGLTWQRFPSPLHAVALAEHKQSMTVIAINRERGEITVKVNS